MNIVVYLGSRTGKDSIYLENAQELGKFIGENNHTLVYGGSNCGLMGELAKNVLKYGGKVIGVRPDGFKESDAYDKCTEMIITKDLSERKRKMIELGDIYIAFPGGTGTLDEISEVMVERSTDAIDKDYVYFNLNNFYDTLYKFYLELLDKDFLTERQIKQINIANNIDELKQFINNH